MCLFSLAAEKEELAGRLPSLQGEREGADSCSILTRWALNQKNRGEKHAFQVCPGHQLEGGEGLALIRVITAPKASLLWDSLRICLLKGCESNNHASICLA